MSKYLIHGETAMSKDAKLVESNPRMTHNILKFLNHPFVWCGPNSAITEIACELFSPLLVRVPQYCTD